MGATQTVALELEEQGPPGGRTARACGRPPPANLGDHVGEMNDSRPVSRHEHQAVGADGLVPKVPMRAVVGGTG